jgi:hypothetical protein
MQLPGVVKSKAVTQYPRLQRNLWEHINSIDFHMAGMQSVSFPKTKLR